MANKFLRVRAESLANVARRTGPGSTHGQLHLDNQALCEGYFGLLVHVDRSDC